jgi:hypothetical protein
MRFVGSWDSFCDRRVPLVNSTLAPLSRHHGSPVPAGACAYGIGTVPHVNSRLAVPRRARNGPTKSQSRPLHIRFVRYGRSLPESRDELDAVGHSGSSDYSNWGPPPSSRMASAQMFLGTGHILSHIHGCQPLLARSLPLRLSGEIHLPSFDHVVPNPFPKHRHALLLGAICGQPRGFVHQFA